MKSYRISEFIYWIIAIISSFEAYTLWSRNISKSYLFLGFAIVSIFMAIFRRHFRKKFDQRAKSKK
tara:strand:- start:1244 stop:1441 length:198 start_codon:yes stop_codon:yes gene_type:complete